MFKLKHAAQMLIVFSLLLLAYPLYAKPLLIEITGGQNIGIPIAVLPFVGSNDVRGRSGSIADIAEVINNDLHNSGHFQVLDVQQTDKRPTDSKDVEFGYWKNFGAANLVIGKVKRRGNDIYDISFQLIDVYAGNSVPLLNVRFRDKNAEDFRALAHYISDLLFEKITGVRGFFSTRIAYISVERQKNQTIQTLTVADADGHNDHALISGDYPMMSPRWSPDGKKIAYVSFKGHRTGINIITVESGAVEQVTKFPGINGAPAWSPDGKRLAMVLSKDGSPKIYVLDLTTKELVRLTSGGSIDTEPFWSPDAQSILFTSNRGGKPQIYRVILQTGEVQRVTFIGNYNTTPSLTPDGKQLIMLHQSEKGAYNIAVQDLNTGKVKSITSASLDESPTLAPNGMMVLYGVKETDQTVLGAVTLDGKFRMRLPVQEGNVKEPAWSPFLLQN